jgi:hypothetical protein
MLCPWQAVGAPGAMMSAFGTTSVEAPAGTFSANPPSESTVMLALGHVAGVPVVKP